MIFAFALISPTPGLPRSAPRIESGGASYSASKFAMPVPCLPRVRLKTVTIGSCSPCAGAATSASDSSDPYSSVSSGTPTTASPSSNSSSSSSLSFLCERIRPQSESTFSPRNAPSASISLTTAMPIEMTAMSSTTAPQKPKNPASISPSHVPAMPPRSVPGNSPAKARTEAQMIRRPEVVKGSSVGRPKPAYRPVRIKAIGSRNAPMPTIA